MCNVVTEPIIKSILDNDLYKLNMQQAVCQLYPRAEAEYRLIFRRPAKFTYKMMQEISQEIQNLSKLQLTSDEELFLSTTCYYLTPVYIEFLRGFRYDPRQVSLKWNEDKIDLKIHGPWYQSIMWEVVLMSIISEVYFRHDTTKIYSPEARRANNIEKISRLKQHDIPFAEFGTRRRHSYAIQEEFLNHAREYGPPQFVGTSNVHFAHKLDTVPIGTTAHEWYMFHAAKYGYKLANVMALKAWSKVYRGHMGIALSDTFTTKAFLDVYDTYWGKLFDGVRQDSGDPLKYSDDVISHWRHTRVDPVTKSIVFSDALNIDKAIELKRYIADRCRMSTGIGTHFTNDVGVTPLNMVIKMSRAKPENMPWQNTVKLSDNIEKATGDASEISFARRVLGV